MFVFQGIDGQYIKFNKESESYVIDPKVNITSGYRNTKEYDLLYFWNGQYLIQVGITRPTRDLIRKLSELGLLYRRVDAFVKEKVDDVSIGLVGQVSTMLYP